MLMVSGGGGGGVVEGVKSWVGLDGCGCRWDELSWMRGGIEGGMECSTAGRELIYAAAGWSSLGSGEAGSLDQEKAGMQGACVSAGTHRRRATKEPRNGSAKSPRSR